MAPSSAKHVSSSDGMSGSTLTTIDDVVSHIRSFDLNEADQSGAGSSSDSIREVLLPALSKASHLAKGKGKAIFSSLLQGEIDPLEMLDPASNTLGYAFILAHRAIAVTDEGQAQVLMSHVDRFAKIMTPDQLVGAGEVATLLVNGIVNISERVNDLVWANPSLLRILDGFRTVQGGKNNLTTLHTVVLYHLLRTAHYEMAHDWILRHDVVTAEVSISPLTYTHVLEFFYYSGLSYTKLRMYDQACFSFEQSVCVPAQSISAVQMDAYKKLILLQLLHLGETIALPNHASPSIQRSVRGRVANIEAYHALSRAFCHERSLQLSRQPRSAQNENGRDSPESFEQAMASGHDVFTRDQNMSLINRLAKQHLQRRLQRLSKHFVRLSLGDLATLLGNDRTDEETLSGIHTALVAAQEAAWLKFKTEDSSAAIQSTTIVHFEESVEDFTSPEAANRLLSIIKESQRWGRTVQEKERSLAGSEAYLSKLLQPGRDRTLFSGNEDFDDDAFA